MFRLELIAVVFGCAVVVGVVGEAITTNHRLERIFAVAVAIGVVGEVGFAVTVLMLGIKTRLIQQKIDFEVEAKNEEERGKLENHISDLKSQLSRAYEKLEEQEPRYLSEEQEAQIVAALTPFAGQKVSVWCAAFDTEGVRYSQQFYRVLVRCGWTLTSLTQSHDFGHSEMTVEVSEKYSESRDWPLSARVFIKVLTDIGLVEPNIIGWQKNIPEGEIRLRIGMKPPRRKSPGRHTAPNAISSLQFQPPPPPQTPP